MAVNVTRLIAAACGKHRADSHRVRLQYVLLISFAERRIKELQLKERQITRLTDNTSQRIGLLWTIRDIQLVKADQKHA
jgi:hypothetical protein